jgi:putative ABC transport system permease protein
MIISWEETLEKLWAAALDSSTVDMAFSINVDRQNLISPWNIPTSIENVNRIADNIENEVLANYLAHGSVNNLLSNRLSFFQSTFDQTLRSYIWVSIPVFFVAWYLGSIVSDVSFNIRRREIGLLSTKGLSSGQIQRMFLSEAIVIGLIGGLLGVVGGLVLNQYYAGTFDLSVLFSLRMYSPSIMIVTVIFGVGLALAAVFYPSRKASKLPAVEALREYLPFETKSRFRFLPWIALILGAYKIVVFASGINIQQLLSQMAFSGGNFFFSLVGGPLLAFDSIMTIFGPFLFFWGFTKVVIRDSTKFQALAAKISSVMGDLGALAAKNVRRNPARLAAIAFLIAFIVGYGVQVNGEIAGQQDFTLRLGQASVGADVTADVVNATLGEIILANVMANVSGIGNATIERTINAQLSNTYGSIQLRTIDVDSWGAAAYYEPGWFSGGNVDQMLKEMKENNNTIIIDRAVAKQLGKSLYDEVAIDFSSCARKLRIIGFFGPEPQESSVPNFVIGGSSKSNYISSQFYSYVPKDLFNMTYGSDIFTLEQFSTRILIKLQPEANGTQVADQIRSLDPTQIYGADSFDEQWRQSQQMNNQITYGSLQTLDIQGLGLVFAVLSASVGTALIAIVSLKERSREATLMSVRGLSYRQLVWMFLTESMAIITFAVILGIIVGVIIVYGSVASTNSTIGSYSLVTMRLVYPPDALATIGTYIALIYASTIGAILVMTSQYVTKLEKMVRAR